MNKQITLTLEQARKIYKKSPEMDELLLANFSKQELEKSTLPTSWTDFKSITGYFINSESESGCIIDYYSGDDIYKDVFATKKQAKSALAMAQLSQLMRVYNGDWEPDWTDTLSNKYVIRAVKNKLKPTWFSIVNQFLAFKTAELRDEFLENFEDLIKEYYMID